MRVNLVRRSIRGAAPEPPPAPIRSGVERFIPRSSYWEPRPTTPITPTPRRRDHSPDSCKVRPEVVTATGPLYGRLPCRSDRWHAHSIVPVDQSSARAEQVSELERIRERLMERVSQRASEITRDADPLTPP